MTATCDWPHCLSEAKPSYPYCAEHVAKWKEIVSLRLGSSELQTVMVYIFSEFEELDRKIDAARCDCMDCVKRRSWD